MPQAWHVVESCPSDEGKLELRRREDGGAWMIAIGGRVIMTSEATRSERALAELACRALADPARARVLIGGLGMGFTLRATLDRVGGAADIVVSELTPSVVLWCRGPIAALSADAASDRRVRIEVGDVASTIARAAMTRRGFDAILLDLWEGPHGDDGDPIFGLAGLHTAHAALRPRGILAIWSDDPSPRFEARLADAGFTVTRERVEGGGPRHVVYIARRGEPQPAGVVKAKGPKKSRPW